MMAFLHRVVNGPGAPRARIEREYAIGSRRLDLCVIYGDVWQAIELKVWCDGDPDPLTQGLVQLDLYLSGLGLTSGWLVIFDQRSGLPPSANARVPRRKGCTALAVIDTCAFR
jgi:hypothetical protein